MKKKQLVIIHGIRTKPEETWPTDLKWALDQDKLISRFVDVHVFRYEYINVFESVSIWKRNKIRRDFQKFIAKIREETDAPISVIAHSLGTHITMSSLLRGQKDLRPSFDLIMLLSCVVDWDYPFDKAKGKFRKVINFVSTKDKSASRAPRPMFGRAGSKGFKNAGEYSHSIKQWSGVYDTANMRTSHMSYWKEQDKWFPYLKKIVARELIYKDKEISEILESEKTWWQKTLEKVKNSWSLY